MKNIYVVAYESNKETKIYQTYATSDRNAYIDILYAFSDFTKNEIKEHPTSEILTAIKSYSFIKTITKEIVVNGDDVEKITLLNR